MLTSKRKEKKPTLLQSHTTILKKNKLYNNEQEGQTTTIKKSKF